MDIPTKSNYDMIPMEKAIQIIASTLAPLQAEKVTTTDSLKRRLVEDVYSPLAHPPFRASVKDGYAIPHQPPANREALKVRAESHAGGKEPAPLAAGTAAYVTTGAPVPEGTAAVVMVEQSRRDGENLFINPDDWPAPGADIRPIGTDLEEGALVLPSGVSISAADIGLLAACAVPAVSVVKRPVIGVLSTGDEVIDFSALDPRIDLRTNPLPFGKIVDSNRPMLLSAIRESLPFCRALDLGVVSDEYDKAKETLLNALNECNIVVTSGGVSMGKRDVIKPILEEIAHVHFGRVLMKPGKPLTFATLKNQTDRCVVALPGNPVSSFVCFHLAVAVAARRLAGYSIDHAMGSVVDVRLAHSIKLDPVRPEYHRAIVSWVSPTGFVAYSTGKQASSRLISAHGANALLALPRKEGQLNEGDLVKAYLLTDCQFSETVR